MKSKTHIAMVGKNWDKKIEYTIIRRSVDRLILVFSDGRNDEVYEFLEHLRLMNIDAMPLVIKEGDFSAALASLLNVLNTRRFDGCQIEFNVTCASRLMTLVASVAAVILKGTVLYTYEDEPVDITEVCPAELCNLTKKKKDVLSFLNHVRNSVPQKRIGKELGIAPSGVSRHLSDLEHAGYISRATVSRKKTVKITNLGAAVINSKQIRNRRVWNPSQTPFVESDEIRRLQTTQIAKTCSIKN